VFTVRIFNHQLRLPYILLGAVEFAILLACGYFSVIFFGAEDGLNYRDFDQLSFDYGLLFAIIMLTATTAMGVYVSGVQESFGNMVIRSVVSYCLFGALAIEVIIFIFPSFSYSRGALFPAVILALVLCLLLRWMFYSLVDIDLLKNRILVLGAGERARAIFDSVQTEELLGSELIGFIPSGAGAVLIDQQWVLDPSVSVKRLVDEHNIDEIVVAIDERRRDKGSYFPLEDLLDCKVTGTHITEVVEFYEREFTRIELTEINTSWMVFSNQFRYNKLGDKSKRVFDILISLALVTVLWPFMLLTALAVFLESGRPIIYRQSRVGFKGRLFNIYKFRSMRQDAEKDGKAVWAKANDSRVTRVGAFIRNTRLDELPQLFNVLKGEMSFVGPRPERPEFVEDLSSQIPFYDARHRVKPGLMGWAQLKYPYGASVEDASRKLVYDLYYVKNHSIVLDLLILVQSVEVIVLGKGVR